MVICVDRSGVFDEKGGKREKKREGESQFGVDYSLLRARFPPLVSPTEPRRSSQCREPEENGQCSCMQPGKLALPTSLLNATWSRSLFGSFT